MPNVEFIADGSKGYSSELVALVVRSHNGRGIARNGALTANYGVSFDFRLADGFEKEHGGSDSERSMASAAHWIQFSDPLLTLLRNQRHQRWIQMGWSSTPRTVGILTNVKDFINGGMTNIRSFHRNAGYSIYRLYGGWLTH